MKQEKSFFKSKKFWTLTMTVLLIIMNKIMKLGLDTSTITQLVAVAGTYLIGQGVADMGKNANILDD